MYGFDFSVVHCSAHKSFIFSMEALNVDTDRGVVHDHSDAVFAMADIEMNVAVMN